MQFHHISSPQQLMSLPSTTNPISKAAESSDYSLQGPSVVPNLCAEDKILFHARETWAQLTKQEWVINQQVEPFDQDGKSVLLNWLKYVDDNRKSWKCIAPLDDPKGWCEHTPINRVHRAIAHVRTHLGIRPYACGGLCGTSNWCVTWVLPMPLRLFCSFLYTISEQRFYSTENRSAHWRGPTYRICEWWYVSRDSKHLESKMTILSVGETSFVKT